MALSPLLIVKLFNILLANISDDIKGLLPNFITQLEDKAKVTANPWDDLAVSVIKSLLNL